MRAVLVVNPKGGCGKTTVATNIAAGLAHGGKQVLLLDLDRQRSSCIWTNIRPAHLPSVHSFQPHPDTQPPKGDWLVIDSPAGIHGKTLAHGLKLADSVVIPVQPSLFDMSATAEFLDGLLREKAIRKSRARIGIVGVRIDARTKAAATLSAFLAQFDLPVLGYLRDSQTYPNAAFNGLSIFDLPPSSAERDQSHWQPILDWITRRT